MAAARTPSAPTAPTSTVSFVFVRQTARLGHPGDVQAFADALEHQEERLVGDSKQAGLVWGREPIAVNIHAPQDALRLAVRYGIYDLRHNRVYDLPDWLWA
jgi:hypothetical protein